MSNINDDEREGYGETLGVIGRNVAQLSSGTPTDWNTNDLSREANTLSGSDEVKNIIAII